MSTTASIAVEHTDGTVSQVYCNFDGYLEGAGATLMGPGYNNLDGAEELVDAGDMREVGESYFSINGEEVFIQRYDTLSDMLDKNKIHQDYNYVFTQHDGWNVQKSNGAWENLEQALKQRNII